MYDYIERHIAPRAVEFYVRTPQGHRIVRVLYDNPTNPRILAYNETTSSRSPATLFLSELNDLLERAHTKIFGDPE